LRRRDVFLIIGGLAWWPLAARAQPPAPERPAETSRLLLVVRQYADRTATGTVGLRRVKPNDDGSSSPHLKLAGSRAWLTLGEQRLKIEDWAGAIACARAGLEALGQHYAPPAVADDTELKLLAAEEQLKQGRAQDTATVMLRMLAERQRLYVQRHADEVME